MTTESFERLALEMRPVLCDECYLDVKLLGRKIINECLPCKVKAGGRDRDE